MAVPGEGGFQFEIKMVAVVGLRGLNKGDKFILSSNIEDAGNFDDLVYTAGGRRYFLQLKHADNPDKNKLTEKDLVKLLQKCFKSYCDIKYGKNFKDIPIDKSQFIIYTNKELSHEFLQQERRDTEVEIIFKTSDKEIFNFIPDQDHRGNLYTNLEDEVKNSKTVKGISGARIESLINEFLNQLIIVTGQQGHWELDNLIADEIFKNDVIKVAYGEYNSILHHFKTPLERWWRNMKRENMTPEMLREWLQRAKTEYCSPVVNSLRNSCANKLIGTGINFSDSEISRLKDDLSNKRAVHLRSDALTLCSILLLDCLDTSKCIFVTFEALQSNKNMLLHAWLGGIWQWLIVFCDSAVQPTDISETCLDINGHTTSDPPIKCLIILTQGSVRQIHDFVPIEHEFKFEQLSKESQEIVLDKKINFQGCEVTMRSVLQRHGNVEHVLGPELVTDLITEKTPVNIGGRLQVNAGYYAPRFLKRKIYFHLRVLTNKNSYSDVFAVSGITKDELSKVAASLNIVDNFSPDGKAKQIQDRIKFLPKENTKTLFSELCKKYQKKKLHWLKYIPKYENLLWKQSRGATDSLLDYVDHDRAHGNKTIIRNFVETGSREVQDESICKLEERTVLVVAEPGMGKSRTTTQVAQHTKLADPTSWVVRINWNEHTRKLQEINAETFNFYSLVELLCNVAFPESKYTDINSSLLKQALQNSGNITVLMEGFDEISSTHADTAAVILKELEKTKVTRVWVTSRPVHKERLEKELRVTAFTLKKLSHKSQKEMLCDIWKEKANRKNIEWVAQNLLGQANGSVYQRNLTGCPLNIIMISSTLEGKLETYLNSEKISLTSKLNLLYLYETFVEKKLNIHETENKKREDLRNASVQDDHEMLKKTNLENLEKCSLLVTLPSELNQLCDAGLHTTIQPFVERLQAGNDKICTAMNVMEKRPHFVHRTFAEYFTARWFSRNFESNRSVLERILFDSSYGILKDMFDRILARGCPLHCAVLNRDTEAVKTLLQGTPRVNDEDSGGRTAMHLIAAQGPGDSVCEEITKILLGSTANVNTKDKVLDWTPLQYARKTENIDVEQLLSG